MQSSVLFLIVYLFVLIEWCFWSPCLFQSPIVNSCSFSLINLKIVLLLNLLSMRDWASDLRSHEEVARSVPLLITSSNIHREHPLTEFHLNVVFFLPLTSVCLLVSPGHFTSPHLLYSQGEEMQSWTSCRWASIHQHILSDHLLQYFDYWALKNSTKKNGRSRRSSHFLEFADHDISFQWTPFHKKLEQGC